MMRQSRTRVRNLPRKILANSRLKSNLNSLKSVRPGDFAPFLDDNYTRSQRLVWLVLYFLLLTLSCFVCYQLGTSYINSPIVVSVEPVEGGSIGEYFPAVTVCNIRKWLAQGIPSEEIAPRMNFILNRRDKAMPHCSWKSQSFNCSKLLRMVLTDWETFCYTFNYEYTEKYSVNRYLGEKYIREHNNSWTMQYIGGLGVNNGLSVYLDILKRENGDVEPPGLVSLKRDCLGFMVLVHPTNEFPVMTSKSVHITPGLENNILIEMNKVKTSRSVFDHPFARRRKNCYATGEKVLAYFDEYSSTACKVECVINRTLLECGCRHWTAPGLPEDKICVGDIETQCYMNVSNDMRRNDTDEYIQNWEHCDCKSRCDYYSYSFSISTAILDAKSVAEKFNQTEEYSRYNMVIFNAFMGNSRVMVYQREVLSTISSLFSNLGGIIGAILGWSLITILNSVLKLFFHYRRPIQSKLEQPAVKMSIEPIKQFRKPISYFYLPDKIL